MKPIVACALFGLVLLAAHAYAGDCDAEKNPDDSDFKHFFKNLGCKVKQGAEDVADAAKPYAEKIGSTVSQKYDELKHKLTDDTAASASSTPANFVYEGPTERVLLAPIVGGNVAAAADLPPTPPPSALPAAAA